MSVCHLLRVTVADCACAALSGPPSSPKLRLALGLVRDQLGEVRLCIGRLVLLNCSL